MAKWEELQCPAHSPKETEGAKALSLARVWAAPSVMRLGLSPRWKTTWPTLGHVSGWLTGPRGAERVQLKKASLFTCPCSCHLGSSSQLKLKSMSCLSLGRKVWYVARKAEANQQVGSIGSDHPPTSYMVSAVSLSSGGSKRQKGSIQAAWTALPLSHPHSFPSLLPISRRKIMQTNLKGKGSSLTCGSSPVKCLSHSSQKWLSVSRECHRMWEGGVLSL